MKSYKEVPVIISKKDLDYFSDIFNWYYGAYKNAVDSINYISDKKLSKEVQKAVNVFYKEMDDIIKILKGDIIENS